ncbi:hypothetical protein PEC18_27195 [Paucibacter sp. O1-1]|nr:hypothetical protein [Paucibacter sp. O1-1]MDA3829428.1 hypothetical protein [Paucibacter sp. O1-1]
MKTKHKKSFGRLTAPPRLCLLVATAATAVLLTACSIGSDIGEEIGETIGCIFSNCKDSADMRLEDISPRHRISQSGNTVTVLAQLSQSANAVTVVRPSGGDRLSASFGGQVIELRDLSDGKRERYGASFTHTGEQPSVSVLFHRGTDSHVSTAAPPRPFVMLEPVGPVTQTRNGTGITIVLGLPASVLPGNMLSGRCERVDGSRFEAETQLPIKLISAVADRQTYQVDPAVLDIKLNERSIAANNGVVTTPFVRRCELTVTWAHEIRGQAATTLNHHGRITGAYEVMQRLNYEAQL